MFGQLVHFGCHHKSAVPCIGIALIVVLVVLLRRPPAAQRLHFGHDGRGKDFFSGDVSNHLINLSLLDIIGVVNTTAVLRSHIVALAIQRRGIVRAKENLQQSLQANALRIKHQFDGFCVAGRTVTDLLVAGVVHMATQKPLSTSSTPSTRSKTASVHQKHPPAK